MNRWIGYTVIGLSLFWFSINLVFAERTEVQWEQPNLGNREMTLKIKNAGLQEWNGFSLTAKILEMDEKPVSVTSIKIDKKLLPNAAEIISVPLAKELSQGKKYRVVAYIQRNQARIASHEWSEVSVFDLNRRTAKPGKIGEIIEVKAMRTPIKPFDIKKAMGLF